MVSKPVGRSVGADTAEWYGWKEKGRELIYIYIQYCFVYIRILILTILILITKLRLSEE